MGSCYSVDNGVDLRGYSSREVNNQTYVYSVNKMVKNSKRIPTKWVDIRPYAAANLDLDMWERDDDTHVDELVDSNHQFVTPNQVLNDPSISIEHYNRILQANLKYPILVDVHYDVLDGLHRLAKAYKQGKKKIKVKILTRDVLEKSIDHIKD